MGNRSFDPGKLPSQVLVSNICDEDFAESPSRLVPLDIYLGIFTAKDNEPPASLEREYIMFASSWSITLTAFRKKGTLIALSLLATE